MDITSEKEQFSYDFGERNGKIIFNDKQEFIAFLNKEIDKYSWLQEVDKDLSMIITSCIQKTISITENIESFDFEFLNNINKPHRHHSEYNIFELYNLNGLPLSSKSEFITIESIRKENPIIAAWAIRFWLNWNFQFSNREACCAAIIMSQHLSQMVKVPKSIRGELKNLSNEYNQKIADGKQLYNTLISDNEKLKKKTGANIRSSYKKLRKREKVRVEDIGGQVAKAIKSLQDTERTYNEFMKLEAPVEYWKEKQKEHKKRVRKWGWFLFLFGLVGGGWLIYGLWSLADHVINIAIEDKPTPVYFIYATIAITITTIVFWCGRILSRLCLSQYHLALDAGERATMVQTYLALTNEGQVAEADRTIILGTLFRPTEDGIVKDEVAPDLSHATVLSKLMSR